MIVQASQGLKQPRPAVLGIASGIFFLTFFGAVWGFTSAAFLSGAFQVVAFLLVGLVTLSFFGMGGHASPLCAFFAQDGVSGGRSHREEHLDVVWHRLWR